MAENTQNSSNNSPTGANSTLPADFLRTASGNDQMTADEEFARQLQTGVKILNDKVLFFFISDISNLEFL